MSNKPTASQVSRENHWRYKKDYRAIYFEHNPGLFGKLWFCSQCGKPLWGKHNVQVDHAEAPSKHADLKVGRNGEVTKTSFMAEFLNNEFNLVAACGPCNRKKSDKGGFYTQRAFLAKIVEKAMFKTQDMVVLTAWGGKAVLTGTVGRALPGALKRGHRPSSKPKIASNGVFTTLFALLVYILVYVIYGIIKFAKGLGLTIIKHALKLILLPITSKHTAWWAKILSIVAYGAIGYYYWQRLFG